MEIPMDAPAPPKPRERELRCDVCDGPAYERHCKVICRQCGYTRDCSDP
ncbi:MAG TPA: hypothetical protein VGR51_06950 [Thermoplasmata archaeon]|nr:hypothetical protein [Thermoplasmata archaeon]